MSTSSQPAKSDPNPTSEAGGRLDRFQVLALDGGGLRGLFAAAILAKLEADCHTTVVEHFDLVVGTSTGGLIAIGLGAGLTPMQIVDLYVELGAAVFPKRQGAGLLQWVRSKHSSTPLRRVLERVLEDKTLGDSRVPLVIPSFDLTSNEVHLFKTAHHPRLRRDWQRRMVDVAMATTAAPTFLPAYPLYGLRLVDGGVWANNPAALGIAEAVSMFGKRLEDVHVLSIGTTSEVRMRHRGLDGGGFLQWRRDGVDVLMLGQSRGTNGLAFHLLGDRLLRVDQPVPPGALTMDVMDRGQLLGRAEHISRHVCDDVSKGFLSHRAPPFHPYNPT